MELTLGPIYYNWKRSEALEFYEEVCKWPVDRVYLGEVVCALKKGLSIKDIKDIGKRLVKSGKEVVLSCLALVSNESELNLERKFIDLPFPVEANDMSVFNIVRSQKSEVRSQNEIIAGPHITSYNAPSIEFLKDLGVKRIVFPLELSKESIRHMLLKSDIEGEVIGYGKVPLAFSWRCYTLRHLGLTRGDCQNNCMSYPEGISVDTLDNDLVFTINGTQVLSGPVYSLLEYADDLEEIGVKAIRISPEYKITGEVVRIFRERLEAGINVKESVERLKKVSRAPLCNGWYEGKEGIRNIEYRMSNVE